MSENSPLIPIPLPDYNLYKEDICDRYSLTLPLSLIPATPAGNLSLIPRPLNEQKKGWPWTSQSACKYSDMTACPKLSVVIPSYQQGEYIEEAIRSVLLQNYPNLELIIIDGGSDDNTIHVLEHYKGFISLSISEKDRGQSHALNKGFSVATGDLHYWLNSDDYMNINSLNYIVPFFTVDDQLDITYGHGLTVDTYGKFINFDYAPVVLERYLRFGGIVLSHSVVWRKRVHCAIWEDLQCAMDAELWLRLFSRKKTKHSHFAIGIFRKHMEQKTASGSWVKKWEHDYKEYIWRYYPALAKTTWRARQIEFRVVQKIFKLLYPVK